MGTRPRRGFLFTMQKQLILDILDTGLPTLDNYVGGSNAPALDALRHQCLPGRAIYLWGAPGSGRTHLLQAVSQTDAGLYLHPGADHASRLEALAQADPPTQHLIAIDDVDTLTPSQQAALFTLYNQWRQQAGTPGGFTLVTAGNQAPRALPLREDVRTRLAWDLVFRLHLLTDEERANALHARASSLGLVLGPELVAWLLVHHTRNMGQLMALIDALNRYSLERHRAITLPLLKDLLKHHYTESS